MIAHCLRLVRHRADEPRRPSRAAIRDVLFDDLERTPHLLHEVNGALDDTATRVAIPRGKDSLVDLRGFLRRFDPHAIAVVVAAVGVWRAQVNHRVVPRELRFARRAKLGEERRGGSRPIRDAVDRAAIAERDGGPVLAENDALELALDVEDRALRRAPTDVRRVTKEAASEERACRLREHDDVRAELASDNLEERGLAGARSSRDHDESRLGMVVGAVARSVAHAERVMRAVGQSTAGLWHARCSSPSMISLRHILVPLDFSEASQAATETAVDLARAFDARVTILNVFEVSMYVYASGPFMPMFDTTDALEKAAREAIGARLAEVKTRYANVDAIVRCGHPWEEIVDATAELEADLVVMGTHGRRGLSHVFLGSVAERVVRMSSVPVLTVRGLKG